MTNVPHSEHWIFLGIVSLAVFLLFRWAFAILPREQWQILAVLPRHRADSNHWHGLNLTYYGFIMASAVTLAVGNMLFLLGAIHVPLGISLLFVLSLKAWQEKQAPKEKRPARHDRKALSSHSLDVSHT